MKKILRITLITALTLSIVPQVLAKPPELMLKDAKVLVDDDYSKKKFPLRRAARGEWMIEDGMASVAQDDALYKKYKNHGPIMVYQLPYTDARVVVEFKPGDCKTVVFTMDAEEGGHAFRVRLRTESKSGKGSNQVLTYAEQEGDKKAKMISLDATGLPKLKNDKWNVLEIIVVGEKAIVKLRGKSIEVEHPRIAQKKKIAKLGFTAGSLAIRKFSLEG